MGAGLGRGCGIAARRENTVVGRAGGASMPSTRTRG